MPIAFWITAAVTLLSAAVSFGFSVAAVRRGAGDSRTSALYTLARSGALLVIAIAALFAHSYGVAVAAAGAMIVVQAVDAVIGLLTRNRSATIGPAILAILNAAALIWLLAVKLL